MRSAIDEVRQIADRRSISGGVVKISWYQLLVTAPDLRRDFAIEHTISKEMYMPHDLESLIDIEQAAQNILRYSNGVGRTELIANDEKISAILYQITIIGEATKRLSMQFRQNHPEIPWRNLAGMRDIIIHEYDHVDFDIVWDVIQNALPQLLENLQPLLINPE